MNKEIQQDMRLPIDRKICSLSGKLLKQPNCPFVLFVGNKKLVKRKAFEAYIDGKVAI